MVHELRIYNRVYTVPQRWAPGRVFRPSPETRVPGSKIFRTRFKVLKFFVRVPGPGTFLPLLLFSDWDLFFLDDEYDDEEDSQEEQETACEITGVSGPAAGLLLSELLACREFEELEGEEEDDVKNDPLHNINICTHISGSIQGMAGHEVIQVQGVVITPGACVAISPSKICAGMTAIRPSTRKFLIFQIFRILHKVIFADMRFITPSTRNKGFFT